MSASKDIIFQFVRHLYLGILLLIISMGSMLKVPALSNHLSTNVLGLYLTKSILITDKYDTPLWVNNILFNDHAPKLTKQLPDWVVNRANLYLTTIYFLVNQDFSQLHELSTSLSDDTSSRKLSIFYLAFLDLYFNNETQSIQRLAEINASKSLILIARYYVNGNDISNSILWYKRAIDVANQEANQEIANETLGLGYQGLGEIYRQQGDTEKSIWFYERAITYLPYRVDYRTSLAQLYIINEQYSEAIDLLHGSLAIAPQTASACGILGELFITTQDWDAAQDILAYCLTVGDDKDDYYRYWHGRNYIALSRISIYHGKWKQSIAQLEQGVRLLGNAKSLWGDTAHQVFTDILNIAPDQPSVYLSIGDFYTELGMYDDALRYYKIARTKWPDNLTILERIRTIED